MKKYSTKKNSKRRKIFDSALTEKIGYLPKNRGCLNLFCCLGSSNESLCKHISKIALILVEFNN